MQDGIRTRSSFHSVIVEDSLALLSQIEPKNVDEALSCENWINAMYEELHQFERNQVWDLVPKSSDLTSVIGTRWIFRNKLNESGQIVRNKARLIAQGYN